jgi:hypothetical protein
MVGSGDRALLADGFLVEVDLAPADLAFAVFWQRFVVESAQRRSTTRKRLTFPRIWWYNRWLHKKGRTI